MPGSMNGFLTFWTDTEIRIQVNDGCLIVFPLDGFDLICCAS